MTGAVGERDRPQAPGSDAAGEGDRGTEALLAAVVFDEAGLVPVIAQDVRTGGVRMFAWANGEALRLTATTGSAYFWSRSRRALWRKGESSGNVLHVRDIRLDCDGDVVLYLVDAAGPSCHTGHTTCFFRGVGGVRAGDSGTDASKDGALSGGVSRPVAAVSAELRQPARGLVEDDGPPEAEALVVKRVAEVIAQRRRERPDRSYVVSLLDAGWPKVLDKISEESGELVEALPQGDAPHTAHEAADLFFHVLVGLEKAGVPVEEVFGQLRRRFGVSGLDEKASRRPADQQAAVAVAAMPASPVAKVGAPK